MNKQIEQLKDDLSVILKASEHLLHCASLESLTESEFFIQLTSQVQSAQFIIDSSEIPDSAFYVLLNTAFITIHSNYRKLNSLIDDSQASRRDAEPRGAAAVVNSSGVLPESLSTALPPLKSYMHDDFLLFHETITDNLLSTPINPNEEMISVSADLLVVFISDFSKLLAARAALLSSGSVSDTPTKVWEPILIDKIYHSCGDSAKQIDLI